MRAKTARKAVASVLLIALLGLGVLRIAAQIEPDESEPYVEPQVPAAETPQTAVGPDGRSYVLGPDGRTYVRANVQQAVEADGIIAVMTEQSAYVWNNLTNTWYGINLSGAPFHMIISGGTVGVLTTDRAYAWSDQTNEWIWTFISGAPLRMTGSNGHLGVMTDREAYSWSRDNHNWYKTILSGRTIQLTGLDDYYRQTGLGNQDNR